MEENNGTFHYTYSVSEQEEIRHIREKYAPPAKEESSIEQLSQIRRKYNKSGKHRCVYFRNYQCPYYGCGDVLHDGLGGYLICPRHCDRYCGNHWHDCGISGLQR